MTIVVERRRPRGWDQRDGEHGGALGDVDDGSGGESRSGGGGNGAGGDYKVGYGRPPLHSRFGPGQSGNPKGRRKGTRNLKTDVKRALAVAVKMRVGDRMQTRSTQEAVLMILREKALRGNERALERLLELARHHNNDEPEAAANQPLADDDRAILAAYVAQVAGPPSDPSIEEPESDPARDDLSYKGKGAGK